MSNQILLVSACLLAALSGYAQTKIKDGTVTGSSTLPNASSVLELESNNKGLLLPRVSLTNTSTWGLNGSPVEGMTVFNTNQSITSNDVAYPVRVTNQQLIKHFNVVGCGGVEQYDHTDIQNTTSGKGVYTWTGSGWLTVGPPPSVTETKQVTDTRQPDLTVGFLDIHNRVFDDNVNPIPVQTQEYVSGDTFMNAVFAITNTGTVPTSTPITITVNKHTNIVFAQALSSPTIFVDGKTYSSSNTNFTYSEGATEHIFTSNSGYTIPCGQTIYLGLRIAKHPGNFGDPADAMIYATTANDSNTSNNASITPVLCFFTN